MEMLVDEKIYRDCGVHIGTVVRCKDMKKFYYKVTTDRLYLIDYTQTDKRIRVAAKFLARYPPQEILVVSQRPYGFKPVKMFCEVVGAKAVTGRFIPGTLTNQNLPHYTEASVLVVTDPLSDLQAINEAVKIKIPVVGICDANNSTAFVDLVIPSNNKGKNALALVYYLLAREILKEKGMIKSYDEFNKKLEDFGADIERGREFIQRSGEL